jgi:predicted component of viral defense system (DUF524 family)
MNKKELKNDIYKLHRYEAEMHNPVAKALAFTVTTVPLKDVIEVIDNFEVPKQEKPVIPQFVADFVEEVKDWAL